MLIRGKEISEQINILGDDGVPLDYHVTFWKSELIDFIICQQDAFDSIDCNCSLERQEFMVRRVMQVCHTEFSFEGFVEVGDFFKELINAFRQMNYAEFDSDEFRKQQLRPMNWYPNVLKTNSAMAAKAFQKIYTKIENITKATCMLRATGVGNEELATIGGRLAQVVRIMGDEVTLQVFGGTEGIPTNAEVIFLGKAPSLQVGDQLIGRFFNAYGEPIDGGPAVTGREVEIGGPSVNPVRREQPSELIATGIAGIDLNNTLVTGQKIPFFADPDQPFNEVMAMVALRAKSDKIILGGMGMTNDDYLFFKNTFSNAGALDRIISFIQYD